MRSRTKTILLVASAISVEFVQGHDHGVCSFSHNDIISDACASYSTIEQINQNLRPLIRGITQGLDYFGYYRLNLFGKQCPFWSDNDGMCGNIACAVNTIDNEEAIPPIWRAAELGKLEGKKASHPTDGKKEEPSPLGGALGEGKDESCIVEFDECDERDYCVPDDETQVDGDYVSLLDNPERFTGYAGAGASAVWSAIYRENCFSKTPLVENTHSQNPLKAFGGISAKDHLAAVNDLKQAVLEKPRLELVQKKIDEGSKTGLLDLDVDDQCLEKRVFYRVISGMHASISMHLCFDYLNQTTGEWGPNLDCYIQRFQGHPERIQNIYFNYALVLRAVAKLRNYLSTYTFCSADPHQNRVTKTKVIQLAAEAASGPDIFDESLMFKDNNAIELKEDFKNRFRNVSRLMDCVGCDKCRLWGKVQTQGYGTALKVLFEFDEDKSVNENPPLRRTELVALINTLDKLSTSMIAVGKFQQLWEARNLQQDKEEQEGIDAHNMGRGDIPQLPTIKEAFIDELEVVWEAMKFIIASWFKLPGYIFEIVRHEIEYFWNVVFLKHDNKPRRLNWWKPEPVDIRAIRDEKKRAKERLRDEL
ncbi:endoplasmic reticulum Oxidoreductin 1-domain-containing protein [Kalaharituber pfeilii]|nr:endoplasmic reticulum Oxidoreductin 1-domain-containing protein [Kalaharituber pfeilii]